MFLSTRGETELEVWRLAIDPTALDLDLDQLAVAEARAVAPEKRAQEITESMPEHLLPGFSPTGESSDAPCGNYGFSIVYLYWNLLMYLEQGRRRGCRPRRPRSRRTGVRRLEIPTSAYAPVAATRRIAAACG